MKRTLQLALALALAGIACATSAPGPQAALSPQESAAPAPEGERPAELEFLIGQELEMDGKLADAYAAYQRALARDPEATYLLKRLAQLADALEKQDEARGYAERALAIEPGDEAVRLFLGRLYRAQGDLPRMAAVLTDAAGDPAGSDAAAVLFRSWIEGGEPERAQSVARWQTEHEPEVPASWLNLAEVTEQRGDPVAAERILRDADAKLPGAVDFLAAIAASRRARGDRLGELGVLTEILARAPKDAATWLAKAEAEFDLSREEDGRRSLERAEALQPGDLRTTMRIALLDMQRGAFAEAERRFAKAADEYPEQAEIAYFLGVARRRLGDADGALQAFDRIPESHSRFADGRVQVAGILEAGGDFAGALAEIERAQSVENSRQLAFYHASLVAKAGDSAAGIAALEAMLDGSAGDAEVLYNVGILQGEGREIDAAVATMQRALALDPNHAGALNYVGYSWAERGERLDEAQALIERALAQRPDDGFITDSLGWVFYMRARILLAAGKTSEATRWLEQARAKLEQADDLTGGDPVISEHLGDVYLALKRKRTALERYEQALAQAPRAGEQPELQQKLERLRRELGVR